jgi:hypothetical protein
MGRLYTPKTPLTTSLNPAPGQLLFRSPENQAATPSCTKLHLSSLSPNVQLMSPRINYHRHRLPSSSDKLVCREPKTKGGHRTNLTVLQANRPTRILATINKG